jgi:hypothetical protein
MPVNAVSSAIRPSQPAQFRPMLANPTGMASAIRTRPITDHAIKRSHIEAHCSLHADMRQRMQICAAGRVMALI